MSHVFEGHTGRAKRHENSPETVTALGSQQLVRLANSDFRVGFLADGIGLCKELTAVMAARPIRRETPGRGPVLVVCPAT